MLDVRKKRYSCNLSPILNSTSKMVQSAAEDLLEMGKFAEDRHADKRSKSPSNKMKN